MTMTRRSMMALAAVALAPRPAFSADERALFWRIGTPTGRRAVIYGATPIAAAVASGLVADGARFTPATQRVAIAFPEGSSSRPAGLPPALPTFGDAVAGRVRAALAETGLAPDAVERLSALAIVARLITEGAALAPPTVPDVLRAASEEISRPVAVMLPPAELDGLRAKVDLRAANAGVTAGDVETLLSHRARHGPIGARRDAVYLRRNASDMLALGRELDVLRGLDPVRLLRTTELRAALRARLGGVLEADYDAFVFLPVETLLGPDGILAALKAEGCSVTALA